MTEPGHCDSCGSHLGAGGAEGLCPACLVRVALEAGTEGADGETSGPTRLPSSPAGDLSGNAIGPYLLREQIGEGGMGEVYLAEQQEPIRRRVALKVIKRGMDTRAVITRFESERQALALMDHPNIAKVLDAGETAEGRPYFVMEYVQGAAITQHCDEHRLTVRERLALFQQVCDGVQHAHQKAVIHRDLKPSNVLVSLQDDRAVPKIIDFGLAKALQHRLVERSLYTQLGEFIGTPEYMSPEQAAATQDVDTRTDVYSLGVLLYELLTGALPFDPRELRRLGMAEIQRWIREEQPPKPSSRAQSLGDSSHDTASARREQPNSLVRRLRGDLDWITLKALEKERARRYGSAAELAADLGRYLSNEAVVARPPSGPYRVRKFIRRNRVAVAVTATAFLTLAAFSVITATQATRIAQERDRAEREVAKAEAINSFMRNLTRQADPGQGGPSITLIDALDATVDQIDGSFPDDPEIEAQLYYDFGSIYRQLRNYGEAGEMLEASRAIRERVLGASHPQTLAAELLLVLQPGRSAQEQEQQLRSIIDRGGNSSAAFNARSTLGGLLIRLERLDEAEEQFQQLSEWPGGGNPTFVGRSLVRVIGMRGDYARARRLLWEEVLPDYRESYADMPFELAGWMMANADLLLFFGESCDAVLPVYREALEKFRVHSGEKLSTRRIRSEASLASCLAEGGQFIEAEQTLLALQTAIEAWVETDAASRYLVTNALRELYRHWGREEQMAELPALRLSTQLVGTLPAELVSGQTVSLTGALRRQTLGMAARSSLWIRAHGSSENDEEGTQVEAGPFPGSRGWQTFEVTAQIPPGTDHVTFGATFEGAAIFWIDDLALAIDGAEMGLASEFGLDFEGNAVDGLTAGNASDGYEYSVDTVSPAASGSQSLKVWYVGSDPAR